MKHVSLRAILLLGWLGLAADVTAQAQAEWRLWGQVNHGQLDYTLFDLDPTDGIAPSLSFLPTPPAGADRVGNLTAAIDVQTPVGGVVDKRFGDDLGPYHLSLGIPGRAGMRASASGRGDADAARIGIEAWANPSSEGPITHGYSWIQGDAIGFVLSPNTRVSFTSAGSYAAEIDDGDFDGQFLTENRLLIHTLDPNGELALVEMNLSGADIRVNAGEGGIVHGADFSLEAAWDNRSVAEAQAYVALNSYASMHLQAAAPPPVPEPGAFPMLVAGLGGTALWARRLRREKGRN